MIFDNLLHNHHLEESQFDSLKLLAMSVYTVELQTAIKE